jgi:hypothetical protein
MVWKLVTAVWLKTVSSRGNARWQCTNLTPGSDVSGAARGRDSTKDAVEVAGHSGNNADVGNNLSRRQGSQSRWEEDG